MAATEVPGTAAPGPSQRSLGDAQIAALTGMRGFAALVVVVVHTAVRTDDYHWLGLHGYGPIALFTLSGFLLYRPFARWVLGSGPRPSLRTFAIRRALRIFPAYWAVLHLWYFAYRPAVPSSFGEWVEDVTLVSTLRLATLPPGLEQAWSIGTEMTWYVALPVLALVAHLVVGRLPVERRVRAHVALVVAAVPVTVGYATWMYGSSAPVSAGLWLPNLLWVFSLGALVALLLESERAGLVDLARPRQVVEDTWILPVVALVFVGLLMSAWAGPTNPVAQSTPAENLVRDLSAAGLAATLLVISVFGAASSPVVRLLSTRFMQATGRWSYGIYLWHLPLIVLLWEDVSFSADLAGLVKWFLLVLPLSYLLGAASYAWVEQPAMNLSKRLAPDATVPAGGGRRRAATSAGTPGPSDPGGGSDRPRPE